MKNKRQHHEEHVDETWLIPYSDMLTLLLALFIVMFAMSKVDNEKLKSISKEFNVIFSGSSGTAIPLEDLNSSENSNVVIEEDKMNEVKKALEEEIENKGYGDRVKIELNNEGLGISIQDAVLFNSGDAEILEEVSPLLLQISDMLKNFNNDIKIVGYTDNIPIHNEKFRSNWELSSMRAINVMNFMVTLGKLPPDKFSIQAYSEYKPKFDNSKQEGRAKNRRVEIFIIRNYPINSNKTN